MSVTLPPAVHRSLTQGVAPLLLRSVMAAVFIAHGANKLWGTFGGDGFDAMVAFLHTQGIEPAYYQALAASWGELLGGVMVGLGVGTRLGALMLGVAMAVATFLVHWPNGFFAEHHGYEYTLTLLCIALYLLLAGPGLWTLGRVLRWPAWLRT
jgi:putative oxidoreductase